MENNKEIEDWLTIFLLLNQITSENAVKCWNDFEKEIKYRNRFFPKGELLTELNKYEKWTETIILRGKKFYRARTFDVPFYAYRKKIKDAFINIICRHFPQMEGKDISEINSLIFSLSPEILFNEPFWSDLKRFFQKRRRFWGYNSKESDAPPSENASEGRSNPRFISYLYLASDKKTAIYEVRPRVDQDVSIATVRIDQEIKIFDFCCGDKKDTPFMLGMLSDLFSKAKSGNEDDYYATQYICEYIKNMGYDGIGFKSSLNPSGKNIVLFDTQIGAETKKKKYTILSSKVYSVKELVIKFYQKVPLLDGNKYNDLYSYLESIKARFDL